MKAKEILITSSGILISIILIYLTFKDVDFSKFILILKKSNYIFILLFFITTFFEMIARTLKWYFILKPIAKTSLKELFKIEVISLGANNILPFRIGELAKVFLVSRFYNISRTTSLSTVFIERLTDALTLFSLFLIYSRYAGINLFITKTSLFITLNILIISVILLFVFSERIISLKAVKAVERSHPDIHRFIIKIKNGGKAFKNPSLIILIMLSGIIQWNFDVLNNFLIAKALNITNIDYYRAALTVFAGSIAASIPSMPGYFGNYEYIVSKICINWQIDKETAILFATSVHLLTYIIITIFAIIFLYSFGLNFKNLINLSKTSKKEV